MSNRPTLLLEHHLKELRLPTFLREYRKLAAQCAQEGSDHPDYLLRLAELELIDRHRRMVERRIRAGLGGMSALSWTSARWSHPPKEARWRPSRRLFLHCWVALHSFWEFSGCRVTPQNRRGKVILSISWIGWEIISVPSWPRELPLPQHGTG